MISYGKQEITQADIDAVVEVLGSDFLTQGPMVPRFEEAVCQAVDAKFGVAVNSGTAALHIATQALDVGPGDWLWTSAITFVASANCGLYCGAQVDFVDIDPGTFNMSPAALETKLEMAAAEDRLPKVVVVVHMCGQASDMQAIHALSEKYGFRVVEDASHAIGAELNGEPVGNCRYSDVTVFSFHPVKIVTSAEGGMAVTNDPQLAQRLALLRSHGITRDADVMSMESHGPWYYEQIDLGYNYRMSDLHAALGVSQMQRLSEYVARRNELASRYDGLLQGLPVKTPAVAEARVSAFHLYVIRLDLESIATTHLAVFESMRELGIGVNLHYIPVYRQPYFSKMGFEPAEYPNAEKYYAEAITIPLYPTMTNDQQDQVVKALRESLLGTEVS